MGRVVKAIVLLGLAFVGLRLAQPRMRAYSFAQVIKTEVESKQVRPSPSELHNRVMELGKSYGLDLTGNDDEVMVSARQDGGFDVKVHYDVPVDLGFWVYQEHFDFVTHTLSGAVPQ